MTIMRWYGVLLPRDKGCAVCGDYMARMMAARGIKASDLDLSAFED